MKIKFNLALLAFLYTTFSMAQIPEACRLKFGTNLAGPSDYGSEYPFVNIMKYGRRWTTHNETWVGGGQNPWDTDVLDQIPLDADGYPLYLPVDVPGTEAPQIVRTLWANTEALPNGVYVVLYDGEGDLDVWGDASLISKSPGRLEFQMNYSGDLFALELNSSTAGNHVRNIRVLLPGTESTYAENPWSEPWLQKLAPFNVLRFMDWGYTNGSDMRNWQERTQVADYTWTQKGGVPYEYWTALCNLKDADAWVCVPHAASDEYIIQMASFFRDNLEPERKIYVEYSNEVWNWIFTQAHYGLDSLDQNLPWPERLAPRIGHVMDLWTTVFSGQENRLERVLACQHAWPDLVERIYAQMETEGTDGLIDAVSPAAYMGLDGAVLDTWNDATTGAEVLAHAADFTFDPANYAMTGWNAFANLAQSKGKKLVFYEGGQHFTPQPFGEEKPYCPALLECQTLPGMYDLYLQLFDTLRTLSDSQMVFMNFSFISPLNCRYGSWGALTSQFSSDTLYADAPKYRALKDEVALYELCQQSLAQFMPNTENGLYVYPVPVDGELWVEYMQPAATGSIPVWVFDAAGRKVRALEWDFSAPLQLDATRLEPGWYLIMILEKGAVLRRQFIKL